MRQTSLITIISVVWLYFTTLEQGLWSMLVATSFAVIEGSYRKYQRNRFHTTAHQWWANVATHFVISHIYVSLVASRVLRLLMFPIAVWILEIIQDRLLKLVFLRNPAWNYTPNRYAAFSGAVDFGMYAEWFVVGVVYEFVYIKVRFGL